MNWKGIFNIARRAIHDNKSVVLFASGVVGVGTCAVLTAKAAPKFNDKVDEIKDELKGDIPEAESLEELEQQERQYRKDLVKRVVVEAVPEYVPAICAGCVAIFSFAMSNRNLAKEAAGAAAACAVAERALGAYQDEVIKELGEEVHGKIINALVDDIPPEIEEKINAGVSDVDVANVFTPELNDKLYYDHVTGRVFYSTDEKIKDAESTINKILIDTGVATINDFYSALLLDCDSVVGDAIGWRVDDPHARNMDVIFGSRLDRENNTPFITIGYRTCAVNLRELERR